MTNDTISAILEHLCNEARNSVHATFGVMEFLREVVTDAKLRDSVAIGRSSADRLLRSIDDVRDLLSTALPGPVVLEEFDLAACASEVIETLTLASGKRAKHMVLDAPPQPLLLTHDRKAVEQMLMRVLDTAFKLAHTCEVRVKLDPSPGKSGVRLAIAARDTDLAVRLNKWLNATLEQSVLQDYEEVAFGVAVMVAGKHLRALGGSAELTNDAAGHSAVVLEIPSRVSTTDSATLSPSLEETASDALNILVAEDCDDSFALTELALSRERVWRARDGREARQMIQKQRFDIVFMDIHMPGMDGYEAIRGIRDWETETGNARTPLVILSSDDHETQRRGAAQGGCSGFLRKPLGPRDLNTLLDRLKQSRTLTI